MKELTALRTALTPSGDPAPESRPAAERRSSILHGIWMELFIFVAYLTLQTNGLFNHGYVGQDYFVHNGWIQEAKADPLRFLTGYSVSNGLGRTNPPLYHVAAAFAAQWGPFASEARNIGLLNLLAGAAGVWLLLCTARAWIRTAAVRGLFALFLCFTPVFVIHNLVTASDVFTMPAVGLVLLGFTRLLQHRDAKLLSGTVLVLSGLFCGILTKFTFAAVPVVVAAFLIGAIWLGLLTRRQALLSGIATVAAPMLLFGVLWLCFHRTMENHFGSEGEASRFTIADLLRFKSADAEILNAPPLSQQIDLRTMTLERAPFPERDVADPEHPFNLVVAHRHSYQALLVDAVFTDILDLRQPGRTGKSFGPRSEARQDRMTWAVRCGAALYLGCLLASSCALGASICGVWKKRGPRALFVLTAFLLAAVIAGPVLAGMLFVTKAYFGGYWLPRLIMPGIACVLLAVCIWLDGLAVNWRGPAGVALLAVAVSQAALYTSFLWE